MNLNHNAFYIKDLWPKLGSMGLLGVTVSPDYGGLGLGYFQHTLAMEVRNMHLISLLRAY